MSNSVIGENMIKFSEWCDIANKPLGIHFMSILTGREADSDSGVWAISETLPKHYGIEVHMASALEQLHKPESAALVREILPTKKEIRSGELGEILATEWINASSGGYHAPINRLRWKDHRDMAMRGEDVIGIYVNPNTQHLFFLKTEAKSREALTTQSLNDARASLDRHKGLISNHTLLFISARLRELGDTSLADEIIRVVLNRGISSYSVRHLIFTFSGNNPNTLHEKTLNAYRGSISQWSVGLCVKDQRAFVEKVYDRVIADVNNR